MAELRSLVDLLTERGAGTLQIFEVAVGAVPLSFLRPRLQPRQHVFDLVRIIDVVHGARGLLAERANVLAVISSEVLLAPLRPQELVDALVASVGAHVEHVVNFVGLRYLLK